MERKRVKIPGLEDKSPFKGETQLSEEDAKFILIEGRQDKITRQDELEDYLEDQFPNMEPLERVAEGNRLLRELSGQYGFRIAAGMVVGEGVNGDTPKVYTVAERINGITLGAVFTGQRLEMSLEEKENVLEEMDELATNLTRYLIDKFDNGEYFWWDLAKGSQYVYGNQEGEKDKHIYLVDVDSQYISDNKKYLFYCLSEVVRFIKYLKFRNPQFKGVDAAKRVEDFLKEADANQFKSEINKLRLALQELQGDKIK